VLKRVGLDPKPSREAGEARRLRRDPVRIIAMVGRRYRTRPSLGVMVWLPLLFLTTCMASQPAAPTAGRERAAVDRLLTRGDIQVAQMHVRAFGFDPGPIDGIYTAQTHAAVRTFQATYGLFVSGLLDRQTREQLKVGSDPKRGD
jgi:hypothetical protein